HSYTFFGHQRISSFVSQLCTPQLCTSVPRIHGVTDVVVLLVTILVQLHMLRQSVCGELSMDCRWMYCPSRLFQEHLL
ncbi:hypothetical protein BKA82DRAFT_942870, partial [Pisolithus tinctorius]